MISQNSKLPKLDTYVYLAYVFFMPLGRFFYRPSGLPTTLTTMGASTLIMLVGVVLITRNRNWTSSSGIRAFTLLYVFMAVYSMMAALAISIKIPVFHGKSILLAPAENIVNYFVTLLSIYYNYYCLSHLQSYRSIWRVIDWSIWLVLAVGLLQVGAIAGIGACAGMYSTLSEFIYLCPLKRILLMERGATGFGSEPSAFANMFFVIVPYLVVAIRYKWPHQTRHIIMLVLFAILFWGSGSASVIIMLFVAIVCAVCLFLNKKMLKLVMAGAFCCGLLMTIIYSLDIKVDAGKVDMDSIEYRLYGKVVDRSNPSTMMRSSTLAVDMKLLVEYPLTGVGLGLQGLWYDELTPQWTKRSVEVQELLKPTGVINNGGGAFFPAYFSAFGFIGFIVLLAFYSKYVRYTGALQKHKALWGLYAMGMVSVVLAMWYVASPKMNENICFLLVLPLAIAAREQVMSKHISG